MFVIALMTVMSVNLAACTSAPDEDAATVLNKAWERLADQNEDYNMGTVGFDGKGSIVVGDDSASVDADLEVKFDTRNTEKAKTALKIDLTADGSFEGQTGKVGLTGEIRSIEKITYLLLESLTLDTGNAETDLMANFVENFFKSKWISINEDLGLDQSFSADKIDNKKIAEIIRNNIFLTVKEDLGKRKYEVEIDAEKLKTFLMEISKETGEEIKASDLQDLDIMLAALNYDLYLQIDTDYKVTWVKGDMTAKDPDSTDIMSFSFEGDLSDKKTEGKLSVEITGDEAAKMDMDFVATHDDSSVSIEVPADAEEFDPSSFLGLGGGLGAPGLAPEAELGL